MKLKKGFTLIELIAVLVILAILALIVTPLVMNIIRKAKISADKRSVDAYGRSVELAIATHLLDTGTFPTDLKSLNVEYTGKDVRCNIMKMKENGGIYLSECTVGTKAVKDSSTEDGWYHYGTRDLTNEEYVDMYGKSIDKALKEYHDINNTYPEEINNLIIESVNKEVSCTSSINYDGTIYLTNCKVDGVTVTDSSTEDGYYHYGNLKKYIYSVGDEVTYNGISFYVIKDSGLYDSTLTLIKSDALTAEEIKNNCPNGFDCEYTNRGWAFGETNVYSNSKMKLLVDNWANSTIISDDLIEDYTGYSVRLITLEDLINNLGIVCDFERTSQQCDKTENTPNFVRKSTPYWTMTSYLDTNNEVWMVNSVNNQFLEGYSMGMSHNGYGTYYMVRPVVTLKKSALES